MANNRFQVKRTSVSGRTPNTSDTSNSMYIAPGEFAFNMADGLLYTSNGVGEPVIVGAAQKDITACTVTTSTATIADYIKVGEGPVGGANTLTYVSNTLIFVGNGTYNTSINISSISVSNTLSNASLSPYKIFVGNNSTNAVIDSTGGDVTLTVATANINSSGLCTLQFTTNHGITKILQSKIAVTSTLPSINTANYSAIFRGGFNIQTVPTANTITFSVPFEGYRSYPGDRNIKRLSRLNGVATCETTGIHDYANGDTIYISTPITSKYSFLTTGSQITLINTTAFTYPNQSTDITKSLTSVNYSIGAIAQAIAGPILLTINLNNHGLTVGQYISNLIISPYLFTCGSTKITVGGTYPVHAINGTTSFTIKIGQKVAKAAAVLAGSGTFNSGSSFKVSYNETAIVGQFCTVGQVFPTNAVTASVVVSNPVGITINNGNNIVKVTQSSIYVGNTTFGTVFDQNGPKQVKA